MDISFVYPYHDETGWDRNFPGYITVFTKEYFAFWENNNCRLINIRHTDTGRTNSVVLPIGGSLDTRNGAITPDPSTFRMIHPLRSETDRYHVRADENGEEKLTVIFAEDGDGYIFTYTVTFREDNVALSMTVAPTETAQERLPLYAATGAWLGLTEKRGTAFAADILYDPCPQSHGIFFHGLDYPVTTGVGPRDKWFTPCPFCIPVQDKNSGDWTAVCAEPTLDEMNFRSFEMHPTERCGESAFFFRYFALPKRDKSYVSPPVVLRFWAKDEKAALRQHAEGIVHDGKIERPDRTSCTWGRGLMACGWSNQGAYPGQLCSQEVYEEHVATYDRHNIPIKIITIDDFWGNREKQGIWEVDTTKWPDLRGFAEAQHAKGRYVLLWVCILADGIDPDEKYDGMVDPMNPKYRARVQKYLHTMLSDEPGCYHCDGIKLDFTGGMPGNPERENNPLFGLRYLYEQFKLYHDAAKAVRPDCLLDFQAANPYFAGLYDMSRLNDYYLGGRPGLALRVSAERAMIASASGFDPFVDMDNGSFPEYIASCGAYGNVSLYLRNAQIEDPRFLPILQALKKDGEETKK